VTHPINFGAQLVARASGRPWASVALSPVSLFSATDPPVFSEPPFEETLAGFWPSFQRVLLRRADLGLSRWLAPYRKIESELGLSPAPAGARASAAGLAGEHGGDRLPVPRARERALTRDPAIPGRRRAADRVHAGIRAVGYAGDFYEHSLDAVARLGRRALLLIGRDPANQPRRTLPPTVLAVHYAPHSAVFPRAAVIVHQGGIGTTGEAMGAGPPDAGRALRPGPARPRAPPQAPGVARSIPAERYDARRATRVLDELLRDGDSLDRARAVAERVRAETGVRTAVDALERLVL